MATENSASGVAKERFLTPGNIILLIVGVVGVVCLIVFAVRAKNYYRRTREVAQTAEVKPLEPKPTPTKTPTPELPESKKPAASLPRKEEQFGLADDSSSVKPDAHTQNQSVDPLVTESKLTKTCEEYYAKAKRFVCDKIREVKNFVVQCQNESPPIRTPGMRGRKQNDVRMFQFERAVLYQMSHGARCSVRNACRKSFVRLERGYKDPRSIIDYWSHHRLEVDEAQKSISAEVVARGITLSKYYELHRIERAAKFQEINT